jgi:hypothetical protein
VLAAQRKGLTVDTEKKCKNWLKFVFLKIKLKIKDSFWYV